MSCNKCKQAPPQVGDSWCLACAGWEALGVELGAKWGSPAFRALAEEAVVNAVKQVRGLRKLAGCISASAGSGRAGGSGEAVAGSTTAKAAPERPPLPRNPPPPPAEKEEPESESVEEEEGESEETDHSRGGTVRELSPPKSRRGGERPVTPVRGPAEVVPRRERSRRRDRDREPRRTRKHRAGRKHKRLGRGLVDPTIPLHRSTPGSYWDLASGRRGLDPAESRR